MDFGHSALSPVIKALGKKLLLGLELSVTYLTMYLGENLCGTITSGQKIIPIGFSESSELFWVYLEGKNAERNAKNRVCLVS